MLFVLSLTIHRLALVCGASWGCPRGVCGSRHRDEHAAAATSAYDFVLWSCDRILCGSSVVVTNFASFACERLDPPPGPVPLACLGV
mmetsp:Transcript_35159/g.92069  ORF Transcript_35159/g.92069 Transcript_35159/m.92069 type:complete len:87 (+) Transcript_35159:2691-2951(+)